jgi:GH18 family chitinase
MTSLKRDYPHLKVLLTVDGWRKETVKNYFKETESPARRKALITSVSEFLR